MPNINTEREYHVVFCSLVTSQGTTGDVRRCEHGRIQVNVDAYGRTYGIWKDLSWFWNPIKYRRAQKALSTIPQLGGRLKP